MDKQAPLVTEEEVRLHPETAVPGQVGPCLTSKDQSLIITGTLSCLVLQPKVILGVKGRGNTSQIPQ